MTYGFLFLNVSLLLFKPELSGSRFGVQACPGATGCGYEIVFTFYEHCFPSPHFDMPGLGQGFKGYNRWTLPVLYELSGFFQPGTLTLNHST
jgi:hypothetical protein